MQLMGRWGSDAVKLYVRDAFIESSASWARRAVEKAELDEVIKQASFGSPCPPASSPVLRETVERLRPALDHERAAAGLVECSERLVLSSTGVAHQVLHGPPEIELINAAAVCGWAFGGAKARLGGPELMPQEHKFLCARCFPSQRKQLKAVFERRARIQIGEA